MGGNPVHKGAFCEANLSCVAVGCCEVGRGALRASAQTMFSGVILSEGFAPSRSFGSEATRNGQNPCYARGSTMKFAVTLYTKEMFSYYSGFAKQKSNFAIKGHKGSFVDPCAERRFCIGSLRLADETVE